VTDISTQAAEWLVRLSDESRSDSSYAEFERWKNADPEHAKAADRMERLLGDIERLPTRAAHSALDAASRKDGRDWTALVRTLCILLLAVLPLLLLQPQQHWRIWLADQRTATGEWSTHVLSDQSTLLLGSASAVNIAFDGQVRHIELLRGEMLIDVAPDAGRPLVVTTTHGQLRALGTRFAVQREKNATQLVVLESKVRVTQAHENTSVDIATGERVTLFKDSRGPVEKIDGARFERAWRARQLVADDLPLPEVLQNLSRHHPAHIHFNERELANLRVMAVLPLDDPERALRLLEESFPLHIKRHGPWWLSVQLASGP
jgi:transmembrane sensor